VKDLSAIVFALAMGVLGVLPSSAWTAESNYGPLTSSNPDSGQTVDHKAWALILKGLVVDRTSVIVCAKGTNEGAGC
jgi:hypothetical protein